MNPQHILSIGQATENLSACFVVGKSFEDSGEIIRVNERAAIDALITVSAREQAASMFPCRFDPAQVPVDQFHVRTMPAESQAHELHAVAATVQIIQRSALHPREQGFDIARRKQMRQY